MQQMIDTGTRVCQLCGCEYRRKRGVATTEFYRSKYCSRTCGARAHRAILLRLADERRQQAEDQREYIECEVQWLLGTDTVASIARRLGYTSTQSLERALWRWDRPDLAAYFVDDRPR